MLLPLLMNLGMFTPSAPLPTRVLGGLSRVVQMTKAAATTSRVEFDFISRLAAGERIDSAEIVISIYRGMDTSLAVQGSVTVVGTKISQLLSGGNPGTVYFLECTATTSEGLKPYLTSYLTVR
jgi:hypothetical protein